MANFYFFCIVTIVGSEASDPYFIFMYIVGSTVYLTFLFKKNYKVIFIKSVLQSFIFILFTNFLKILKLF